MVMPWTDLIRVQQPKQMYTSAHEYTCYAQLFAYIGVIGNKDGINVRE